METSLRALVQGALEKAVDAARQDHRLNCFDQLVEALGRYYDAPVHSVIDLRRKNQTKRKGDLFEVFAQLYFRHIYGLSEVWLLGECPPEVRDLLKIAHQDLGIDLIARDQQGRYYAIQAKYRSPNRYKSKSGLSWQCLSTFYALVHRTGPYYRHIIFTNAHYARHSGHKSQNDVSICLARLRGTSLSDWCKLTTWTAHTLGASSVPSAPAVPSPPSLSPPAVDTVPTIATPSVPTAVATLPTSAAIVPVLLKRPIVIIHKAVPPGVSAVVGSTNSKKPLSAEQLRELRLRRFDPLP